MIQVRISFLVDDTDSGESLFASEMAAVFDEETLERSPEVVAVEFANLNSEIQKLAFVEMLSAKSILVETR